MGIKAKTVCALLLLGVLALLVVCGVLGTVGVRQMVNENGEQFHAKAQMVAEKIGLKVDREIARLRTFVALLDDGGEVLTAANAGGAAMKADARVAGDQMVENSWVQLAPTSSEVSAVVDNHLSDQLRRLLNTSPLSREVIVADRYGRVVAATRKTTDYIQSDEEWWQEGMGLDLGVPWFDELHVDQSAGVFSLDVVFALFNSDGRRVGVVKAVFDVTELMVRSGVTRIGEFERVEIVLRDGAVLAELGGDDIYEALSEKMTEEEMTVMNEVVIGKGWVVLEAHGSREKRLAGVHAEPLGGEGTISPKVMVVYAAPYSEVMAPVRAQLAWVVGLSLISLTVFLIGAFWYMNRSVLRPIGLLSRGAKLLTASADFSDSPVMGESRKEIRHTVAELKNLKTGDELESLGKDFAKMSSRVLRYHRELESQVAEKTATIRADLEMAREFQEAMMPTTYPAVPDESCADQMLFRFWHVYRPSDIVGGDFFDMFPISKHRAGVFIADVMGHGARSALVTAILRALLPGVSNAAGDPGHFLELLNKHFCELMERGGQTLFVTGLFLVVDTKDHTACYATAGHGSPIIANRHNGNVRSLFTSTNGNPALGLFPGATYQTHELGVEIGDLFFLFTDGLIEAENDAGEQFDEAGMIKVIERSLAGSLEEISQAIVGEVEQFVGGRKLEDDLCLVAAEAFAPERVEGE